MTEGDFLIIGIHGLNNKPEKKILFDWWISAILEGLKINTGMDSPQFEFQMVYWADRLYPYPLHRNKAYPFDDLFNNEPYLAAEDEALREHKDGLEELAVDLASEVGRSIFDQTRLGLDVDTIGDMVVKRKLRDLYIYYAPDEELTDTETGETGPAREILMSPLHRVLRENEGRRMMLIAHSMGSIIAYDVLRNLGQENPDFAMDYFVTIGSPLGLGYVKRRIVDERGRRPGDPLRTPSVVRTSWLNMADRRDPVAVDSRLGDDFKANSHTYDVAVVDDRILNDYTGSGGKPNYHKSYGYLRTPEVSRHIAAALQHP